MRLYRLISYEEIPGGPPVRHIRWAGTMQQAREERRGLSDKTCAAVRDVELAELNVPTDKVGLLDFLNNL